jgi:RNA polymerase sigma-70 factor (ECF subfamily)
MEARGPKNLLPTFFCTKRSPPLSIGQNVGNELSTEQDWQPALFDAMSAKLLLYGRALGLGHAEGEDVLQETFVALLKLKAPPKQPEFCATRAYRNKSFTFKRSLMRRFRRENAAENWFEPVADKDNPEEALAVASLKDLPPAQREVIVLKIWHGRTFDDIGGLLEISPNTAAARYRYGLQKLKKRLENLRHEQHEQPRIPHEWLDTTAGFPTA